MTTEAEMKVPLKHRTLSAAIVDQLRQSILDGTYPAGSQLRQDALGEAYGVSRIPVREALFQLEAEGLVRIVPQKGAIVSELSLDEINDVFDLRADPGAAAAGAVGAATLRQRTSKAWMISRSASRRRSRRATSANGGSSMPTFIWRCTFTRGSHVPRRSSSRCCKPATAIRACSYPTPRRWVSPRRNTPI